MNRTLSTATCFGVILWTMAAGANDAVAPLLGNTLTVSEAGETIVLKFNEDGTYTRNDVPGTWEVKDNLICMKAENATEEHCEGMEEGHQAGDTWNQVNSDGNEVTMSIVSGQ